MLVLILDNVQKISPNEILCKKKSVSPQIKIRVSPFSRCHGKSFGVRSFRLFLTFRKRKKFNFYIFSRPKHGACTLDESCCILIGSKSFANCKLSNLVFVQNRRNVVATANINADLYYDLSTVKHSKFGQQCSGRRDERLRFYRTKLFL